MDEPTKRRGPLLWLGGRSRRFWITLALTLPVLYVASVAPFFWIATRTDDRRFHEWGCAIYLPVFEAMIHMPSGLYGPMELLLGLGSPSESRPGFWRDMPEHIGLSWSRPTYTYTALSKRRTEAFSGMLCVLLLAPYLIAAVAFFVHRFLKASRNPAAS